VQLNIIYAIISVLRDLTYHKISEIDKGSYNIYVMKTNVYVNVYACNVNNIFTDVPTATDNSALELNKVPWTLPLADSFIWISLSCFLRF
jgi:hypothetical protein